MFTLPQTLRRRLADRWTLALAVGLALVWSGMPASAQVKEASRVHFLVVADTDAQGAMVFGLGLDGDNVKRVVEEQLSRAGKSNRYTLELFTGNQVTPLNILNYYKNLKATANDALVFYYTGHGIWDHNNGHMITTHKGFLPRKVLLETMQKHNPHLTVLLTDCCANFAPGAPPPPPPPPAGVLKSGGFDNVHFAGLHTLLRQVPPSDDDRTRPKPNVEVEPIKPETPKPGGPPQPPDLMSNLFFQHKGLVDINAAEKGTSASGKFNMGGSYFTIALTKELRKTIKDFDRNEDKFCEWREFYPHLEKTTIEVSQQAKFFQKAQAFTLGEAVK